jgi:hypothetical protein
MRMLEATTTTTKTGTTIGIIITDRSTERVEHESEPLISKSLSNLLFIDCPSFDAMPVQSELLATSINKAQVNLKLFFFRYGDTLTKQMLSGSLVTAAWRVLRLRLA